MTAVGKQTCKTAIKRGFLIFILWCPKSVTSESYAASAAFVLYHCKYATFDSTAALKKAFRKCPYCVSAQNVTMPA